MKEKKRKLNQNKKKLSERRNPHSLKTKNQKPKKPQQQLILLMNFYSLQILFFRQTKYNTETRNSENNSNNNKKQKKREKTKRSKEFKIELKKKKKKEGEKEISDLRCRLVAIKRRCLANILGCNRVIPPPTVKSRIPHDPPLTIESLSQAIEAGDRLSSDKVSSSQLDR